MDDEGEWVLTYRKGFLSLTNSHLLVARDGYVADKMVLRHISQIDEKGTRLIL